MGCAWYAWQQRRNAAKAELGRTYRQGEKRAWVIVRKLQALIEADCIEAKRAGECPHFKADCSDCSLKTPTGEGRHGGWCNRRLEDGRYVSPCVKHPRWDMSFTMSGACEFSPVSEDMKDYAAYPECPIVAKWASMKDRASRLWGMQISRGNGRHFERCVERMAGPEPGLEQYAPELAEPMFQAKYEMENPIEQSEDYSF